MKGLPSATLFEGAAGTFRASFADWVQGLTLHRVHDVTMAVRRKLPTWWFIMCVVLLVVIAVAVVAAMTGNWESWRITLIMSVTSIASSILIFRQALKDTDPAKRNSRPPSGEGQPRS